MSKFELQELWNQLASDEEVQVAEAAFELSNYYLGAENYLISEELSKKTINILEKKYSGTNEMLFQSYINFSMSLKHQDKNEEALNVIKYVLNISHKVKYSFFNELMFIKANLESELNLKNKAVETYEELLLSLELDDDILRINHTILCLAEIFLDLGNKKNAEIYLNLYNKKFEERNNLDNVISYLKTQARLALWNNKIDKAREFYEEALEQADLCDLIFEKAYLNYLLASCEFSLQNYFRSKHLAKKAKSIFNENAIQNKDGLTEIQELLNHIEEKAQSRLLNVKIISNLKNIFKSVKGQDRKN